MICHEFLNNNIYPIKESLCIDGNQDIFSKQGQDMKIMIKTKM